MPQTTGISHFPATAILDGDADDVAAGARLPQVHNKDHGNLRKY